MHLQQITFRAPPELVAALNEAARTEAKRLDLPVDRSAILRRLIARELTGSAAVAPMGLATSPDPTA